MSKFTVTATWDDAPHLTKQAKEELWASIPEYQREARTKGIPTLGAGAIYPIPEDDIRVPDFQIPEHYPRAFGLDVGWNRTAGVWGALDRDSDTLYLYSEHYRGEAEPSIHATAIKARGKWIPGVIDPAARSRSQVDGRKLIEMYRDLELDITEADHAVESGIYRVHERLSSGRLKVFQTLSHWISEYRLYRRKEGGQIVKDRDHLMDATRYLEMSFLEIAKTRPLEKRPQDDLTGVESGGWML